LALSSFGPLAMPPLRPSSSTIADEVVATGTVSAIWIVRVETIVSTVRVDQRIVERLGLAATKAAAARVGVIAIRGDMQGAELAGDIHARAAGGTATPAAPSFALSMNETRPGVSSPTSSAPVSLSPASPAARSVMTLPVAVAALPGDRVGVRAGSGAVVLDGEHPWPILSAAVSTSPSASVIVWTTWKLAAATVLRIAASS
jgi:hypothetical protein